MNYTKPNDKKHIDNPGDWLFGMLVFGKALGLIIPDGEGIVVDLVGDMIDLFPEAKRVIVFSEGNQMAVMPADERTDLKEGDCVKMINEDTIIN